MYCSVDMVSRACRLSVSAQDQRVYVGVVTKQFVANIEQKYNSEDVNFPTPSYAFDSMTFHTTLRSGGWFPSTPFGWAYNCKQGTAVHWQEVHASSFHQLRPANASNAMSSITIAVRSSAHESSMFLVVD